MAATLKPDIQVIAEALQESAAAMSHSEIRGHLSKALGDNGYVHDVNGDDKSGDVVYSQGQGIKKAPYKIRTSDEGSTAKIDHDSAVPVSPRTVYEAKSVVNVPRGTQGEWKPDGVLLRENAAWSEAPKLSEAQATDYPIKLISPGRGSSGYYPPEVLKKAAESKVFKAGTQMFWNHDTDAEESARPEGDLNRLAAVTTTDAAWNESGHDGPGLYARAKVFGDYAAKVKEMGPHIGLSIRAGGDRNEAIEGPDGKRGVITALRNAASVDFVTKAGRDGKIFTESATREGDDMDKNEMQALLKESLAEALKPLQAENKRLQERLELQAAPRLVTEALAAIRLPDASKKKILEKLTSESIMPLLPMKEGKLDQAELAKLVESEAAKETTFLMELGYNVNPASIGTKFTEADVKADIEQFGKDQAKVSERLADIFVGPKLPKTSSPEKLEAREAARAAFVEGRAA